MMKKVPLVASIGIIALLCLQTFWLHNLYYVNKQQQIQIINKLFNVAIEKELTIRECDSLSNEKDALLIVQSIDSINLENINKLGLTTCYSEILSQNTQDKDINNNPIQLHILDSLFTEELNHEDAGATVVRIFYYDQFFNLIHEIGNGRPTNSSTIFTNLKPIGTKGLRFVQAAVILPPKQIVEHIQYELIASFSIVCIVLFILYYQWSIIMKEKKLLAKQKQIVYAIIHDLKSPLNSLYTFLDFIEMDQTEPEQRTILDKGKKRIKQIAIFIDQMLDVFRKNTSPFQYIEIHLLEFIKYIWQDISNCYPDKTIQFNIINRLSTEIFFTDPTRLERCLRNLFDNALKYSDRDVSITVTLSNNQNKLNIEIKDTGWGIPKNDLKKSGNLFYRVRKSIKPTRKGYGIGLCSVNDLLQELGGSLQIESTEGVGSTFTIQL